MRSKWSDAYSKGGDTLERFVSTISYGKWAMSPSDNIVLGPVDIPCSGRTSKGDFDSSRCGPQDFLSWAEIAMDYAAQVVACYIL